MAVKFHVIQTHWPSESTCKTDALRLEEGPQMIGPHPLTALYPNPICYEFKSEGQIQRFCQLYESLPDQEPGYWRARTIVEVMCCLEIQHVSFIPNKPQVCQILYMKRNGENRDISDSPLYTFHIGKYRYILAAKEPDFTSRVEETGAVLQGLNADVIVHVIRVLFCFQQDAEAAGIALTIGTTTPRTYLWLK